MDRRAKRHAAHQLGNIVSAHRYSVGFNARDRSVPDGILVGVTHQTLSFHSFQNFNYRTWQFTERIDHTRAGLTQCFHFTGMRAATTFNNRSRVTEARAFARSFATDVGDERLGYLSITNHLRQFLFL